MAQTRTTCPRCKTPVLVDVDQLFDLNTNPQAKQRLLSGEFNLLQCKNCGYQGVMSTPLVYHDPAKELLLTFFPPEMGLPVNEQERLIGPLITQVVNKLPLEKRKAYLFRPQTMFTMQTMLERILEADGITKEMIEAQQKRLAFLQRLLSTPQQADRAVIIKEEEALVDQNLFAILSRLGEASLAQGDQQMARQMASIQQELLSQTTMGQELQSQAKETEAAVKSLQAASEKGLTREALLDLLVEAPTEIRLQSLVGMARSGLDYSFFQMLSGKIDAAAGDEKEKLTTLRSRLLDLTAEIDKAIQAQLGEARKLLETILSAADLRKAIQDNLEHINDYFMEVLDTELKQARQKADLEKINKLQSVMNAIREASTPPPEIEVLNALVEAPDEVARQKVLEENAEMITPEFVGLIHNLIQQVEQQKQPPELQEAIQTAYKAALRFSMQASLRK